jgi:hypothetical protein
MYTYTLCIDKMQDFLNTSSWYVQVPLCSYTACNVVTFRLKGANKTENYILLNSTVVPLATTKT